MVSWVTDWFTKAVFEHYKDQAKILYIEPKEDKILGLFFAVGKFDL